MCSDDSRVTREQIRKRTLSLFSALIAFCTLALPNQFSNGCLAQTLRQEPVFKATTELVELDVQVLNKKTGQPIGSLKPDDLRVYEDHVRQSVSFLSRDELPLSIVFLFDLTDSVRPVLKPLAEGARQALEHLKSEDEVAVMVYSASAEVLQNFTRDRGLAVAAIEKARDMKSREAAFFNEGVFQAALESSRASNPRNRRVIIWLTDNVPNIPSEGARRTLGKSLPRDAALHTQQDALDELFKTGTTLCAILERSMLSDLAIAAYSKNPMLAVFRKRYPPGDVHQYANKTGGIVLGSSKQEVSTKLAQLIDQIRARYTLGYRPAVKQRVGTFCRIKVTAAQELEKREGGVVIKAKEGYFREGAEVAASNASPSPE